MEIKALEQFLENYRQATIAYYMDRAAALNEEYRELYPANSSIKLYGQVRSHLIQKYGKGIYELAQVKLSYSFSDIPNRQQTVEKMVAREVKNKRAAFINQCEKHIGKILDASHLTLAFNGFVGEINGYVIGETGKAKVETISAGGYNIQRYHYRTLVKKIK